MSWVVEYVFNTTDDECVLEFSQKGTDTFKSNHITRTVLTDVDQSFVVDSDTDSSAIFWNANQLTLKLGKLGLEPGVYPVRIVAYDIENPDGITLVHEYSETPLRLQITN